MPRVRFAWRSLLLMAVVIGQRAALAADAPRTQRAASASHRVRLGPLHLQSTLDAVRQYHADFKNPTEAAPVNGCFELVLSTSKFPVANPTSDPTLPKAFELLSYNSLPVGPTIRVKRGSTFCIRVTNALQPKPANAAPTSTLAMFPPTDQAEQPQDFCLTNLHTHGLHVSPDANSDNVYQVIKPGDPPFEFKYSLNGKHPHPTGTFWYHPHHHHSVAYQLSNGLAGALIVEGSPNDEWHSTGHLDLEDIPEIKAASQPGHEKIIVFQLYNYRIGTDSVARIDASQIYNIRPTEYNCDALKLTSKTKTNDPPTVGQATAINGVLNPTIVMAPGEVQRWRLIHAGWDQQRSLVIDDASGQQSTQLSIYDLAHDGLATGDLVQESQVDIAPGQRSDVLVQVPQMIASGTTFYLSQLQQSAQNAPHSAAQQPVVLATILVQGPAQSMQIPDKNNATVRANLLKCRPFVDLPPPAGAPQQTLTFYAWDGNPSVPFSKPPQYEISQNVNPPLTFHQQPPLDIAVGSVQQWVIAAGQDNHPFHIHVNAFQVVGYQPNAAAPVQPRNDWRDTLYVLDGEQYTIRSSFDDFVGDSVLHCHILDHEDQGMMMCLRFKDPNAIIKPQGPGCPKQSLKAMSVSAPELRLSDIHDRMTSLRDFRGRSVILVFFLGLDCPHCTSQLRQLIREAREAKVFDTEIVAVSSEPIPDVARARAILDFAPSDPVHLLADPQRSSFRSFQCLDNGEPVHGAFVIDPQSVIRSAYVGPSPYAKTRELIEIARSILARIVRK